MSFYQMVAQSLSVFSLSVLFAVMASGNPMSCMTQVKFQQLQMGRENLIVKLLMWLI